MSTAGLSSSQVITSNEASCSINKSSGSEKQFWALFGTDEDDSDSYSFELKFNNQTGQRGAYIEFFSINRIFEITGY